MRLSRRAFIVSSLGGIMAAPLAVQAQPAGKVPRVGVLVPYAAADPGYQLPQALRDEGFVEGRDIVVEWRHAEGRPEHIPTLAAELARLRLDAIVVIGDVAIEAVRKTTATIPIIAGSDDLVGEGHVATLARPGGNVTGVSILGSVLNTKRLDLLKQAVPSAARIAVLWDPATGAFQIPGLEAVARTLGVELKIHDVRNLEALDRAFDAARTWRAEGLNVLASPLLHALRHAIIDRAARDRLPAIYQWEESATAGGFMAYGPVRSEVYRTICVQLARVLKGAKPADLAIEQPTHFELVINLKTARALGVTVPPALLQRTDGVIE
jgi:putative ABC transport system substrate-binding protein